MIKYFLLTIALLAVLSSCVNEEKYKLTESGLRYIKYTEHLGRKPHEGDYVTLNMIYKLENDSVLFDSREAHVPMRYQLRKPSFSGAVEEGIMFLSEGDSASFFVSADSLFEKVFHKQMPDYIRKGSHLTFDIYLLKVQNAADVESQIRKDLEEWFITERKLLDDYISENRVTQRPTKTGLYVIVTEKTKRNIPVRGNRITVHYTGKFLNGKIFDADDSRHPYAFELGTGKVLAGWEEAFSLLREGEKATLIIPSELGYGENGKRSPTSGVYIVPPYTPLIYEVEVISIQ
ncbi:MAG: FKBP-type peptidyl-prolyl cis-trans isomerase [Bacteroidia bacterium]|nr:FKBP-type peptidyl-prolyl cis-trans isomerase [Bacteroidia bacterium]